MWTFPSKILLLLQISIISGWHRANFLHSNLYGAVAWVCDWNTVTIRCYWWVVHAQHWDFVFPHSPPTKKKSGKTLEVSRECNWGSWSNFTTGILPVIWCHKIYVKLVRKWIYFLFNSFFFAQYIFYWDCFICFKPVKFNFCPAPENSFSPSCKAR